MLACMRFLNSSAQDCLGKAALELTCLLQGALIEEGCRVWPDRQIYTSCLPLSSAWRKDQFSFGYIYSISTTAGFFVEACAHASICSLAWRDCARSCASGGREEGNEGGELHVDDVFDSFGLKRLKSLNAIAMNAEINRNEMPEDVSFIRTWRQDYRRRALHAMGSTRPLTPCSLNEVSNSIVYSPRRFCKGHVHFDCT